MGFAFCVKIWWIAPLVIVAVWLWRQDDRRRRLRGFVAGAANVVAIIDGPFFDFAAQGMAQMIVLDQVGRWRGAVDVAVRHLLDPADGRDTKSCSERK